MAKITVKNTEITVTNVNGEDYICITDMLKAKDGDFFVTDWLRNRNTMEFLGDGMPQGERLVKLNQIAIQQSSTRLQSSRCRYWRGTVGEIF